MGGDYARFTFNPSRNRSGVLKQQGRVDLDADWNELVEIMDRRWRSETTDIMGRCVVPMETPNAFRTTPTALGQFTIGIGRAYVHGLQVENHGLPPLLYDRVLGEQRGTVEVPYLDQPFFPAPLPPPIAPTAAGRRDLVYIDVWSREVTAVEDPQIQEVALGGPDTCTRLVTAWQVKVLRDVGPVTCEDTIAAWDALTAPSAGRLTTAAVAPPAADDPCVIDPAGGYRGLENRLYRVEIHATGGIGGATPAGFKWSRDNGSILSRVEAIPNLDQVVVTRIGRDPVLRFRVGDWIEIHDDHTEFRGESGDMARVTNVDEANRILTFAPALPAGKYDPANLARHTRVRRWDQRAGVDPATGLLDVVAGPITIEDGIQVTFTLDPAAGDFRVGDYWVFAARTADGSVEVLQAAPPRGILHHYCRLGIIVWGATLPTTTVIDCRHFWPPHCCEGGCTVTVGDGVDSHGQFTDIQLAVNALGDRGGVVCIGRGVYPVTAPIVLGANQRNVTIRGMGEATRILFAPAAGAAASLFRVEDTRHVVIEGVFAATLGGRALVSLEDSSFCSVLECTLVNLRVADPGGDGADASGRAIDLVSGANGFTVERCRLLAAKGVAAGPDAVDVEVLRNRVLALHVSVSFIEVQGLRVVRNQLRGLHREALATLAAQGPLSRGNVDAFQALVASTFASASSATNFHIAGVLIVSGRDVVLRDNIIVAYVGVVGFLLLGAVLADNIVFSLLALLLVFGISVRVRGCLLFGLLAGLVHGGILAALDCEANVFLGLYGIVLLSLGELAGLAGLFLGTALGSSAIAGAAPLMFTNSYTTGTSAVGELNAFGFDLVLKVHRNVFFTYVTGIHRSERMVSADVSIIDNTFLLCSETGIFLGSGSERLQIYLPVNPRHLVQSNAFAVTGNGVVSRVAQLQVLDNSILSGAVAVELDGPMAEVRNNVLAGRLGAQRAASGLVVVHNGARRARIQGNRIRNGPGHGILIHETVWDLGIVDNDISRMALSAIATASAAVSVMGLRISGNTLEGCWEAAGGAWHAGALVLGGGSEVSVVNNTVVRNGMVIAPAAVFHAVYGEDVQSLHFAGNLVSQNGRSSAPRSSGAVLFLSVQDDARIQGNSIRLNGGSALVIDEPGRAALPQSVLVQDNCFEGAGPGMGNQDFPVVALVGAERLHYQGNVSSQEMSSSFLAFFTPSVFLNALHAVVVANTVNVNRAGWSRLAVHALPPTLPLARAIVTSNLVKGPIFPASYPAGGVVLAQNLSLP